MFDVITIGSATLDVFLMSELFQIVKSPKFLGGKGQCFSFGSKIELDDFHYSTGGGATNSATTFSRLGFRVACLTEIGSDLAGEEILKDLKKEKIDARFVIKKKKELTGYSTLMLTKKGQRTVLVYRGASEKITEDKIPFSKLSAKWFYITSLGGDLKLLKRILDCALRKKVLVALNPGSKELKSAKLTSLLKFVKVLIVNREEAAKLTKQNFDNTKALLGSLAKLVPIAVMTDGPAGAYACEKDKCYKIGIYPFRVKDATGAGDAFGSAFVAGLQKYNNLEKALQLAAWNASMVVTAIGAKMNIVRSFPKKPLKITRL
jgi:ribokinase